MNVEDLTPQIAKRLPVGTKISGTPDVYRVVQSYKMTSPVVTTCDWLFPNHSYTDCIESYVIVVDKRAYTPDTEAMFVVNLTADNPVIDTPTGTFLSAIFWRDVLWGYASDCYESDFAPGCLWMPELIVKHMGKIDKDTVNNATKSYPDAFWCHVERRLPINKESKSC